MRDLSLVQLHMGLRNLLGERKAALEMSAVGVAYVPIFNNYLVRARRGGGGDRGGALCR